MQVAPPLGGAAAVLLGHAAVPAQEVLDGVVDPALDPVCRRVDGQGVEVLAQVGEQDVLAGEAFYLVVIAGQVVGQCPGSGPARANQRRLRRTRPGR